MKQITLTLLIVVFCNFSSAQSAYEQIDRIFSEAYQKGEFCGRALIVKNDSFIYQNGYGYANEEWELSHNNETKFKVGSVTKQFTAALIMLLQEEGKICLDSSIRTYIPEYPEPNGKIISIHQLLSHSSGIPDYFFLPQFQELIYKENKPSEFIKHFWDLPLDFEPGVEMKYSNSGYFLLGYIIERVSGKTYSEMLQERIFKPLGMDNSGVYNQQEIYKNKAYGYISVGNRLQVAPYVNASGAYSAGAIYSNCEDLSKWCQSLLHGTLLSRKCIERMTTVHASRYGYGFTVGDFNINGKSTRLFGHEGEIFGYRSLVHILPESNSFIVILDNNNHKKLFALSREIIGLL